MPIKHLRGPSARRLPAAAAALALLAAVPAPAATDDRCRVPATLTEAHRALPRFAAAVGGDAPPRIVALGSSSTAGSGASGARAAYPSLLQLRLGERLGERVEVVNKGVGGEIARDMIDRLQRDVVELKPSLVVWQTGTNDFLKDADEAEFERLLHEGIRRIRSAGADVILLEPQYIRRLAQNDEYRLYVDIMRRAAAAEGVPIFRRFDIMAHWLRSGHFDEKTMLSKDGLHMIDASYLSLAELLTEMIADGVRAATQSAAARATTVR
jgi:acyl-CoA thioesterase I